MTYCIDNSKSKTTTFNYIKYTSIFLLLYIIFFIFFKVINIYTLIFILIAILTLYILDKRLFKKIIYKIIYKDKKNFIKLNNKFGAAKISLNSIEEINKKINDKVKAELLNYEKNILLSQLIKGD